MTVKVRVPASTTNFGPGFDCLGAALSLWNEVTVEPTTGEVSLAPMFGEVAAIFFRKIGRPSFPLAIQVRGDVPSARGLGSSVTVRLGVLIGLNRLLNDPLPAESILWLCSDLEGHPDNAAAALFGGFTIVNRNQNRVHRFPVDESLKFVLLIPDFEVRTEEARRVVPKTISRDDAVTNIGNAAVIAAAFASGRYESLAGAFTDRLHQPARGPLVPFLPQVLEAAAGAGALGGFLSGSGSTICALTLGDSKAVAAAMREAGGNPHFASLILQVDNVGAKAL
jgi:homoserine kinase